MSMSTGSDLAGAIGFFLGIGLHSIHREIVGLRDDIRNRPALSDESQQRSQEDEKKISLYNAVDELLRVHSATCNDRELSCKCYAFNRFIVINYI